ncbi:hypothetical protein M9H77_04729 [Catharanthus roseus]|uniref:Uncharacterized protein n=1 Tax=Catharanthus roseus TaxID=4058 RepID=A0ACC0CFG0_CATRO|nr:hypothetical protein M9H77_04729 [Catharanthus roseus]
MLFILRGIFGSVIIFVSQTWCIHRKGPVFVAIFRPLSIAIAAFTSFIFLGDTLHLGTIIGAVVITIGFYGVIWAQAKENQQDAKLTSTSSPFLGNQGDPLY